jgi:hypothetical protein
MRLILRLAAWLVLALSALHAGPIKVGWYTTQGAPGNWASAIAANGLTAVPIGDFSVFDFSTVNIVTLNNSSNTGIEGAVSGRLADLTAFVSGGGILIIHDRWVVDASWIPGGAPLSLVRAPGVDLDVVTGGTKVTNGPFGTIDNSNLDGGNMSHHGWASSVPAGTIVFLSAGSDPSQAAAFVYPLGSGYVYYSTIPIDFYQEGSGFNPPRDNFVNIYAPNVLAYSVDLLGAPQVIPEPATYSLVVAGLLALMVLRQGRLAR